MKSCFYNTQKKLAMMSNHKTYLNDPGKIFSINVVVRFQVDFPKLAGSNRVVLGVEFIKSMESLSSLEKCEWKHKSTYMSVYVIKQA